MRVCLLARACLHIHRNIKKIDLDARRRCPVDVTSRETEI